MNKTKKTSYNFDDYTIKSSTSNSLTNDSFNDPKDKARKHKKSQQCTPVNCSKGQGCDCK